MARKNSNQEQADKTQREHDRLAVLAVALLLARSRRASQAEDLALLQRELADSVVAIRAAARTAGTDLLAEQVDELGIALNRRHSTIVQFAADHAKAREAAARIAERFAQAEAELGDSAEAFAATKPRIIRAAVTETATAFNDSRAEALRGFESLGILMREWVVDGNPCPDCEAHDGETTGINDSFGGDEPGSMHPNCRCVWIPVASSLRAA